MDNENVVVDKDADKTDQENAQTDEKSLDALLDEIGKEYDEGTKPPKKEDKGEPNDDLMNRVADLERKETETDIDSAADMFIETLGEVPFNVTTGLARSHLSDLASKDDRFNEAWKNRQP